VIILSNETIEKCNSAVGHLGIIVIVNVYPSKPMYVFYSSLSSVS
jgi:hypothetical protein